LDSSSVTKPSFKAPPTMQTMPDTTAIALAIATARAGSPAASGSTTARITGANDESGPSTRMRLGPKIAYASSGKMVA
jgi:hypothetical protein